jgi:hypothetical protein
MIIHNPILTGSFTVNGTDVSSITGSAASITALNSYTASQNILNGTYATTGSNTFAGIQTVNSNLVVTGSITAQTLVVQTVTSSVDFVTGSTRFGSISANTHVFTGSVLISGSVTTTKLIASSTVNSDPELASFTNTSTGSAAEAAIYIKNGATTNDATFIETTGTNFTTTGGFIQDGGIVGTGTDLSGGLSLMVRANADMRFYTNGHTNERMRISSSGNIGIGTTNPSALLNIEKSTNSGDYGVFPMAIINNSLATQGNGTSSYNFAAIYTNTGNGEVKMGMQSSYAAGTWEPQGILNVATNHPMVLKTNNTERMRISSAGIITAPSQVSFKAYMAGANPYLSKSTNNTIPYNAEEYDTQGNFSTSTYRFTAPVAGKYLFTVNLNVFGLDDTAYLNLTLYINSSSTRYLYILANLPTGNTGDTSISGSDILSLAAGDTVAVRVYTDGTGTFGMSAGGLSYNSFSGHLLG